MPDHAGMAKEIEQILFQHGLGFGQSYDSDEIFITKPAQFLDLVNTLTTFAAQQVREASQTAHDIIYAIRGELEQVTPSIARERIREHLNHWEYVRGWVRKKKEPK